MSFTMCTSGAIVIKAGANVDSTAAASSAILEQYSDEAESYINSVTRYNWTDAYASLNADVSSLLGLAASNLGAMYLIQYDMSGFTSRTEAQTMLDVLSDGISHAITLLKEQMTKDFMVGA